MTLLMLNTTLRLLHSVYITLCAGDLSILHRSLALQTLYLLKSEITEVGTSLMVQWLRLYAANVAGSFHGERT